MKKMNVNTNINKMRAIIKRKNIEILGLRSTITEVKIHQKTSTADVRRQKR